MKRTARSADESTGNALSLVTEIGKVIPSPLAALGDDGKILFVNPGFIGFTAGMSPGFLIQYAKQVSAFLPEPAILDRVWRTGEPCSVTITIPLAGGEKIMEAACLPYINERQRVGFVTIICRDPVLKAGEETPAAKAAPVSKGAETRLERSYREFGDSLERFSQGSLEKIDPLDPDDPLVSLKRSFNDGIEHMRRMNSVRGLFD